MISIFYSTRKKDKKHFMQLKKSCVLKNVEIIEFINEGTHSLAQAYNLALEQSKHDILVCIHDDVYLEKGWDKKILKHFENSDYGILGVAGTTDLDNTGMWWKNRNRMVGSVMHTDGKKWVDSNYSYKQGDRIMPVVCIDGLFMAMDKSKLEAGFDERFEGYHFYDIPFCISNFNEGVEIGVVTNIKVKHDSVGAVNEDWNKNREMFTNLYEDSLPCKITPPIFYKTPKINLKKQPKLGIIIPSKDNFEYLERCVKSLLKTSYENYKIYIADTGSDEYNLDKLKELYKEVNSSNENKLNIIRYDYYHFSKINNQVVSNHMDADTEIILFCNDDIVMLNDAISIMVKQYLKHKKHVGTIGCRLYYEDNTIQHGGIQMFLTKDDRFHLSHEGINSYYKASFDKKYDVLGNTAAFLMISRDVFYRVKGFTEETEECMEDVILNLDCILKGLKNIYLGQAVCYHYESVSRKKSPTKIDKERNDLVKVLLPKVNKHILTLKKYINIVK